MHTETIFVIKYRSGVTYGVSPDGEGVYWYDTMADVVAAHGKGLPQMQFSDEGFDDYRERCTGFRF